MTLYKRQVSVYIQNFWLKNELKILKKIIIQIIAY